MQRMFRHWSGIPRFLNEPEHQSAIPSQDHPQTPPFDPRQQPDIKAPIRTTRKPFMTQGEGGNTIPRGIADVRSVYDSRPLFGYDFYWEDAFADGDRQTAAFIVPNGYTFVLRQVGVEIFRNANTSAGRITQWGGPVDIDPTLVTVPKLQIHVDGASTPLWTPFSPSGLTGVPIQNALITGIEIETFIVIPEGSSFTIFIPNFTQSGAFFDTFAYYQGNALLNVGSDVAREVTSQEPLPVVTE